MGVHCNVTAHPTAAWTLQQLREAIPSDHSYRFLIHDRDAIFSAEVDQTRESWSRSRRVVAKAEHLEKGENPRFVVTSLSEEAWPAQALYEEHYCARGEMENRIKEQLMLFSDRTSTHYLRSNQLRLYFSSIAYVLLQMLRRLGLQGTELAQAQCTTIRLKLLKIGALIRITVRKVWVSLAGGYPYVALFQQVYEKLCSVPLTY
jgi:Transposase DDE domain group 1